MGRKKDEQADEPLVKRKVHEWYKRRGAFSWAPVSNGFGVHGIPDRVGCVPVVVTPDMVGKTVGIFVAVESKAEHRQTQKDGGLSANQLDRRRDILEASGVWAVAYDVEVGERLDRLMENVTNGRHS